MDSFCDDDGRRVGEEGGGPCGFAAAFLTERYRESFWSEAACAGDIVCVSVAMAMAVVIRPNCSLYSVFWMMFRCERRRGFIIVADPTEKRVDCRLQIADWGLGAGAGVQDGGRIPR